MNLFLDDRRACPKGEYDVCRNADDAIFFLSRRKYTYISLDYDLGYSEKTGLDVLVFMKEQGIFVEYINIHSSHIFGKRRMEDFCAQYFPKSIVTKNSV